MGRLSDGRFMNLLLPIILLLHCLQKIHCQSKMDGPVQYLNKTDSFNQSTSIKFVNQDKEASQDRTASKKSNLLSPESSTGRDNHISQVTIDGFSTKNSKNEYIVAVTKLGPVRGRIEQVQGINLGIFLGIPFAQPPIAELRFRKPIMLKYSEEIRDALSQPNTCPQLLDQSFGLHPGMDLSCFFIAQRNI